MKKSELSKSFKVWSITQTLKQTYVVEQGFFDTAQYFEYKFWQFYLSKDMIYEVK